MRTQLNFNTVQLLGNLGADPEVRSFSSGGRVLTFGVATAEQWKDRNSGERKERTTWHRVAIFAEVGAPEDGGFLCSKDQDGNSFSGLAGQDTTEPLS